MKQIKPGEFVMNVGVNGPYPSEAFELRMQFTELKMLVKKYGLCHPDLQVARMSIDEAAQRWAQEQKDAWQEDERWANDAP